MLPRITGLSWDEEEYDDEPLRPEGELTREDVDLVFGPKEKKRFAECETNLCEQLWERHRDTTPDYLDLKRESSILVMVYGTLKKGGFFHDILEHNPYLGVGLTADANFYLEETTSFPVVRDVGKSVELKKRRGKIKGEIYAVDPLQMLKLDQIEHNGKMYQRRKIWIKFMDQASHGVVPSQQCWVYIGIDRYWDQARLSKVTGRHDGKHIVYDWNVNDEWSKAV